MSIRDPAAGAPDGAPREDRSCASSLARSGLWRKRLLLLGLSTLLALALAEGTLRAYFWSKGIGRNNVREILERSKHTELPELGGGSGLFGRMEPSPFPAVIYQLKPHLEGTLRGAMVKTNRFGLRGPEITKRKPERTYRLVGIGDSHMFGWAVAQGEEYMALLERQLNQHAEDGYRFEVLNFGTPGYNTVLEVATLEHRALEFDPDLVLLHFVGNDFVPPHFLQPPRGMAPSSWYLVELVRGLTGWSRRVDDPDHQASTRSQRKTEYAQLGGEEEFKKAMRRLAEVTRARRLPVLLFTLGLKGNRRLAQEEGLAGGFRYLNIQPSYGAMMAELNVEEGSARYREMFQRNQHPSPLGHQAYARTLFCELERMAIPHLRPAPAECVWERAAASQENSDSAVSDD